MKRTIAATAALIALAACSGQPPQRGAIESSSGEPDGWAFPGGQQIPTYGTDGMVSTTDRVATEIGVEVLRRGGNAVDAAVATHFALAVVNPEAGNLGGGGFMMVRMADGRAAALDFREKAPLHASRDMYLDAKGELTDQSRIGHLAVGVPGSVRGMWEAHRRFGSLPWADLVEPAVTLADGIVVHERLAQSLQRHEQDLRRYHATASIFLPGDRAPRVGERLIQRDLAGTLRRIGSDGSAGFYSGATAGLLEAEMRRGGGLITRDDLARYQAVWREPVTFKYREHTIISMPPPSSGGATLAEILNILEGYDLRALGYLSRDHVHVWAEAVKRAFADRNAYLGDPDFAEQPVERMTSDGYAAGRRSEISRERAQPSAQVSPGMGPVPAGSPQASPREGDHTTHFSVVDKAGNAVAVTTTINSLYGSLVTVAGAGFLLNNEMDDFAARPGTPNQFGLIQGKPNAIEPGKRMLSAMTPTIVLDPDGHVRLVTGSPGGPTIITTIAQLISNAIDFGMSVASATAAPRLHHQHLPDILYYEREGLKEEVVSALRALGHTVEERGGYQGDTQSIFLLPNQTLAGVADPRRGGAALGVRQTRRVVQ
jgi:gamma-glutamyltranspeptidase/glutathione hydrolase